MQKCLKTTILWYSETVQECQALGTFGIFVWILFLVCYNPRNTKDYAQLHWAISCLKPVGFLYSVFLLNCKTLSNFCGLKNKIFGFWGGLFQMCLLPVFSVLYQFLFHFSWSIKSNWVKKFFCSWRGYVYWERWADEFHFALIQCVV